MLRSYGPTSKSDFGIRLYTLFPLEDVPSYGSWYCATSSLVSDKEITLTPVDWLPGLVCWDGKVTTSDSLRHPTSHIPPTVETRKPFHF